jgi:hypothetical protein
MLTQCPVEAVRSAPWRRHHDLEEVRALLGHARIDTTQIYANIRPAQLERAVAFFETKAIEMLSE